MTAYGGAVINRINTQSERTVFSDNRYFYALYVLKPGQKTDIDFLGEYSLFVQDRGVPVSVKVDTGGESQELGPLDCLNLGGCSSTLTNTSEGDAYLLLVGTKGEATKRTVKLVRAQDLKKVFKPWGHELWINGESGNYCLKEVFLKAGRKTSLQYHRKKQETNVLFEGTANYWFKKNSRTDNDEVHAQDLGAVEIQPISSVDVVPHTLHRLEAVSDIKVYEASTPDLDDVVRVMDDNNRKDGRIDTEHKLQICILTAGKGDRMGGLCDVLNKALLPVKGKAVISRIVEKFPKSSRFVIALGYKGDQVRSYLEAAYPEHEFEFVELDNYDRPGAGPGYSLRSCRSALQEKPFYFVACDTLIEDEIPFDLHQDWMGVCGVNFAISDRYCNFTIESNNIVDMIDKEPYKDNHSKSFIGLSYIFETEAFWRGLEDFHLHKGEWQMTNGIRQLIAERPVKAIDFRWTDVGSYQQYAELTQKEDGFDFGKADEFLFMTNQRVIKFFNDRSIAQNRVQRVSFRPEVFPKIDFARDQFYSYELIPGKTLYEYNDLAVFEQLLKWLEADVWQRKDADLYDACMRFYRDKTLARSAKLFEKYPRLRRNEKTINGRKFSGLEVLLERLDWSGLAKNCIGSFIHGDLQFDNILRTPTGEFKLIDWRQDFAGLLEVGDLYYDLAKLYGGLRLNYDLIKQDQFTYEEDENGIRFDFLSRNSMADYQKMLEQFIQDRGFDLQKVKTLVGVIYVNMAPLHHYPFDKLLFALGTKALQDALDHR